MNSPIYQDPRLAAFAEQKMRTWTRLQETAARTAGRQELGPLTSTRVSYVAISREAGAAGPLVARLVGEQLGWEVYDKNLLDRTAQRYNESRLMLDQVDETAGNWIYDVFGTWMDPHVIPHVKYMVQVGHMIQVLARAGNAVFVGRGAQFLLPRSKTLAVRIVASETFRVARVQQRQSFGRLEALDWMHRADRGRQAFIQHFFHRDINDPHLYDLVLNVERLSPAAVVDHIVRAVCRATS